MALSIYKPGQGKYARVTTGVILALWSAYGVNSLKVSLGSAGSLFTIGSQEFTYAQVVPVVVFLAAVALIAWLLNFRKFADFLIETEAEMGRVIWPSRSSVVASSIVVIVTLVVMSALLWGVDTILFWALKAARLY